MFAQKSGKYVKNKPKQVIVVAGSFKLLHHAHVLLFSSVSCQLHDMNFVCTLYLSFPPLLSSSVLSSSLFLSHSLTFFLSPPLSLHSSLRLLLDHGGSAGQIAAPVSPHAQKHLTSELCWKAADRDERANLWWAGRRQPVQRISDLQAVVPHHQRQRAAVEETVFAGQSCLSEGGGQGPKGRPVLEGQWIHSNFQKLVKEPVNLLMAILSFDLRILSFSFKKKKRFSVLIKTTLSTFTLQHRSPEAVNPEEPWRV